MKAPHLDPRVGKAEAAAALVRAGYHVEAPGGVIYARVRRSGFPDRLYTDGTGRVSRRALNKLLNRAASLK